MTASNHPTRILTCLLAAACLAAAHAAAAVDYADGAVNTIDAPLLAGAGGARVFDGPGATTTTLNLLDGAVVNGLDAFDGSLVNIFDGATVSTDLNARDTSTVNILGGTLLNADVLDDASLTVSGGTFTGSGGRAIGAFGNAAVTITDMSVTGAPTFALLGTNSAHIDLIGGAVNGEVRMEGDAAIDISGGSGIAALTATSQSTITLFGPAFSLGGLGAVSLAVPFVIDDDTWNGQLLSGTLADGSSISADIFNGISGSQIVLAAAPIPLPAAAWLLLPAAAGLLGCARRRNSKTH